MVRYRIKLTKEEVEELTSIINKGSHTSQSFRAAYVLLNCDEGEYSHKVINERISEVLKNRDAHYRQDKETILRGRFGLCVRTPTRY